MADLNTDDFKDIDDLNPASWGNVQEQIDSQINRPTSTVAVEDTYDPLINAYGQGDFETVMDLQDPQEGFKFDMDPPEPTVTADSEDNRPSADHSEKEPTSNNAGGNVTDDVRESSEASSLSSPLPASQLGEEEPKGAPSATTATTAAPSSTSVENHRVSSHTGEQEQTRTDDSSNNATLGGDTEPYHPTYEQVTSSFVDGQSRPAYAEFLNDEGFIFDSPFYNAPEVENGEEAFTTGAEIEAGLQFENTEQNGEPDDRSNMEPDQLDVRGATSSEVDEQPHSTPPEHTNAGGKSPRGSVAAERKSPKSRKESKSKTQVQSAQSNQQNVKENEGTKEMKEMKEHSAAENATVNQVNPDIRKLVETVLKEQFANVVTASDLEIREFNLKDKLTPDFLNYLKLKEFHTTYAEDQAADYQSLEELMRTGLCLKVIFQPENQAVRDRLFEMAGAEALKTVDVNLLKQDSQEGVSEQLKLISALSGCLSTAPEFKAVRAKVDQVVSRFNVAGDLSKAGLSKELVSKITGNEQANNSLCLAKAFTYEIEMDGSTKQEKENHFRKVLRENKRAILSIVTSPHTKLALASLGFAMACSTGGFLPLAVAAPRLMSAVVKNSRFSELVGKYTDKLVSVTQKAGVNIKPAVGLLAKARDTLANIAESKAFKYGTLGMGAVAVGGGLVYLCERNFDIGIGHIFQQSSLESGAQMSAGNTVINTTSDVSLHSLDVTLKHGDTLWDLVEKQYQHVTGVAPTPQQITKVINDMGVADPNDVSAGFHIKMPTDFSDYSLDKIGKVHADWLGKTPIAQGVTAGGVNKTVVEHYIDRAQSLNREI